VNEGRSVRVEVNSRNKRELSGELFPPLRVKTHYCSSREAQYSIAHEDLW
jgi:hypothetical protein